MNIAITMAGYGSRFKENGYDSEKYEIVVGGQTLFNWSISSLQSFIQEGASLIFIVRKEQNAAEFIHSSCQELNIRRHKIIELPMPTEGQAATALEAYPAVSDKSEPFAIYNIDTYITPGTLSMDMITGSGWIPCFDAAGDHWSFVKTDNNLKAVRVEEKVRISNHATVGFYYFSSFSRFADATSCYYSVNSNLKRSKEKYIAPVYNHLISNGLDVYISTIPADSVHCLGTPEEMNTFETALKTLTK